MRNSETSVRSIGKRAMREWLGLNTHTAQGTIENVGTIAMGSPIEYIRRKINYTPDVPMPSVPVSTVDPNKTPEPQVPLHGQPVRPKITHFPLQPAGRGSTIPESDATILAGDTNPPLHSDSQSQSLDEPIPSADTPLRQIIRRKLIKKKPITSIPASGNTVLSGDIAAAPPADTTSPGLAAVIAAVTGAELTGRVLGTPETVENRNQNLIAMANRKAEAIPQEILDTSNLDTQNEMLSDWLSGTYNHNTYFPPAPPAPPIPPRTTPPATPAPSNPDRRLRRGGLVVIGLGALAALGLGAVALSKNADQNAHHAALRKQKDTPTSTASLPTPSAIATRYGQAPLPPTASPEPTPRSSANPSGGEATGPVGSHISESGDSPVNDNGTAIYPPKGKSVVMPSNPMLYIQNLRNLGVTLPTKLYEGIDTMRAHRDQYLGDKNKPLAFIDSYGHGKVKTYASDQASVQGYVFALEAQHELTDPANRSKVVKFAKKLHETIDFSKFQFDWHLPWHNQIAHQLMDTSKAAQDNMAIEAEGLYALNPKTIANRDTRIIKIGKPFTIVTPWNTK